MEEFAATRGDDEVRLLSREQILERIPAMSTGVTGGMYLPNDLQVDPAHRRAVDRTLARR